MAIYDLDKMQDLLKDFYSLTGIKICIYDKNENELCYYPEKHSGFCKLIRKDPLLKRKCEECDRRAFETCKKTHKQHTYTCHAGLIECISPIIINEKIIGYIAIGQIRAKNIPKMNNAFLEEYNKLPVIPFEKISASMRILDACTGYEYLKGLIEETDSIDFRLNEYILKNIGNELSTKELCLNFHLSRNELYSIFKKYFDATPADFIKKKRLDIACKLLKTTSLHVNEIATQCGIPDYNYFSKVFKKQFGLSPTQYKKGAVSLNK